MAAKRKLLVPFPNDSFVRDYFSEKEAAIDLLSNTLPAAVSLPIVWPTLERKATDFIAPYLKRRSADLLFSVQVKGMALPCYLYILVEHQSTVDRLIVFRLWLYMQLIWQEALKNLPKGSKLPLILPFVLYQGTKKWDAPKRFRELFEIPRNWRGRANRFFLDYEYVLLDLNDLPAATQKYSVPVRAGLLLMKLVGQKGEIGREWEAVARCFEQMLREERKPQLEKLWFYLFQKEGGSSTWEKITGKIESETLKREVMTIGEHLLRKGRKEGLETGLRQGNLIGMIQAYQDLLHEQVSSVESLARKKGEALKRLCEELKQRAQKAV